MVLRVIAKMKKKKKDDFAKRLSREVAKEILAEQVEEVFGDEISKSMTCAVNDTCWPLCSSSYESFKDYHAYFFVKRAKEILSQFQEGVDDDTGHKKN